MSILLAIQKWSTEQPDWQQDAIARIYNQSDLSAEDLDDLYALLKAEHGIPDPAGRQPRKFAADQIAGAAPIGQRVQLASIKNLLNVNALAPDQHLLIARTGLSVIYGENGAGKSGYSRALKKACRARDQSESIHPDARLAPGQAGTPQASFDLFIDDLPTEVVWKANQAAPESLSAIAIFDSYCARAYVDNKGDFAYIPYGLDILEKLVGVCGKLKTMASAELEVVRPKLDAFSHLGQSQTKVGALIRGLSSKTKTAELELLATISDVDKERFAILVKALTERDPKEKALELKAKASRYNELDVRICSSYTMTLGGGLGGVVFDDPVSSLDHRRRWLVAKRLAQEALKRQVIIFTHDIYFLCILQQCATELDLELTPQCIRKAPGGFGVHSERVPFDAMVTTKRISALRKMYDKVKEAKNTGDDEAQTQWTRDAYYHLRLAWERAVEEVLLFGTVTRFEEGISTQRLRSVIVEDDDYMQIETGMTKCSKFAHDPAAGAHLPTPSPEELSSDIETLEKWRASVEKRREVVRKRRT
ncbi:hypothetical protein [Janthinobacterium kumbetense]|uniref:Protein CR006 P-loop domain-containing protein n=1 Tax=Janthinobacterium kumbetense TaxID=2950280 RepID=A0ABT0WL69_9BURK|nr:hypothetical protein [Janthinobacterium kumbetense]MCM2564598.1 hypothetical protein [Janthinobacterium kumbetense]